MDPLLFAQEDSIADGIKQLTNGGATRTELLAALSALGGVIVYLWRQVMTRNAETENLLTKKWEECEEGHKKTTEQLITISSEVGSLRGKIEVLSSQVLNRVSPDGPTESS